MTIKMIVMCIACVFSSVIASTSLCFAQASRGSILETAESRLRGIYEEGEFRAKTFRADWLADSSGYTIRETDDEKNKAALAKYDAATGERTLLDMSERNRGNDDHSPDGKRVIFRDKNNLKIRNLSDNRIVSITESPKGKSVSHYESSWSPDGKKVAFIQSDASKVRTRSVLVHDDPSYPGVRESRFARVGEVIAKLRVGVADAGGGETRWLDIPQPEEGFYLGTVDWAGNSEEVLVEWLSRFRDERQFLLANAQTGAVKQIFHEKSSTWVVASVAKNSGLEWIRDGQAFVVMSEKDGWRHAYLYSRDGKEKALLTPGESDIIERVFVDEVGGWFYYNASPTNATQKYLYRVRLDGSEEPERVTPSNQSGTHDYDFSPDGKWAFHTYSSFDKPPVTELVRFPDHEVIRVLEDNSGLHKKMEAMVVHPTEFFKLDIGDDVEMDGWMVKPSDFDPSKTYPVFIYVYGEPHAQTVLDAWGKVHADYHRVIADLGYVVVSIDNRGTPAPKGAAWRRAVYGSLGPLSTEEQAKGLKELARTRSYIDLSRVGIWGWSGGGSNTLNAMFRRPNDYHVGIAVAAKPQPHLYNAWFQEMYMQDRKVNAEGYEKAAALSFADGLKGDLLIIHGTGERNTHLEIIEGLVDRLIELGKPFDYMCYPGRDHGIRKGAGTSVHLRMHMIRYLLDHLAPGPR